MSTPRTGPSPKSPGGSLVPIGVVPGVQSPSRPGQVHAGDDGSDNSEEEPPTDHPGHPECLPFRSENRGGTSCHVDDSPDHNRQRRKTHEDLQSIAHASSFRRSAVRSYVRMSPRPPVQFRGRISEHCQKFVNFSSENRHCGHPAWRWRRRRRSDPLWESAEGCLVGLADAGNRSPFDGRIGGL
jgi:hypothetical protein